MATDGCRLGDLGPGGRTCGVRKLRIEYICTGSEYVSTGSEYTCQRGRGG